MQNPPFPGILTSAMSMPDEIVVQHDGGTVVVCPAGELDLAVADSLRAALEGAVHVTTGAVRVDLASVTFVDSTALAVLVDVWRQAREREVGFCVTRPVPNVRRVLDITGLGALLCEGPGH